MQAHCHIVASEGEGSGSTVTTKKSKKTGAGLMVPDTDAILADFQLMGEGLVKSVEVLSPPPPQCCH